MRSQVSALLWKEFRQLPRKRGAVLTAVIFPFIFFFVLPAVNMVTARFGSASGMPVGVALPPGIAGVSKDPTMMMRNFMMPLVVTIAGLMLPSVMATYTIITERERRTFELLVALPVSIKDIILAKLLAVLLVAAAIGVPLLAIDLVGMFALGMAGVMDAVGLFWLLFAGLAYSTASALLISLLAGDYRTANNLNGAFLGPLLLVAMGVLVMLPAGVATLTLGALLLLLTLVVMLIALRWLTFERLLG